MDLFHSLHEDRKKTIVFITHSRELAEETQRTVTIRDGQIIREERRNDHGSMGEYRTGCEWASGPVSYTHLDVYKRQLLSLYL